MRFKERDEVDPFFYDPEAELDYQYLICPECFEEDEDEEDED